MKLYIFTSDNGDGSRGVYFTLDSNVVEALQTAYDNDETDYESLGCDGDGFGYTTVIVPDDSTPKSLGISVLDEDNLQENVKSYLKELNNEN